MDEVIIYTDGAARGNPGPGGYGAILRWHSTVKELSQGYRLTTNNRMELMAVIAALEALKTHRHSVKIYSDSNYVVKAVEEGWLKTWITKDFRGKKNKDLWMRFYELSKKIALKFVWVKGHAENAYNNRCDVLATLAADNGPYDVDTYYEQEITSAKKL